MSSLATFQVGANEYLLTGVGSSYHAVKPAYEASHEKYSSWAPRTVCGRHWRSPADPDGDPVLDWEPAIAPTCRSCLRILTSGLATTRLDERVAPLVTAMAASVVTYGSAQCSEVPGDQSDRLRALVKARLRGRSGRIESLDRHAIVLIVDRDHPGTAETETALREAMAHLGDDSYVPRSQAWLFGWHDWTSK